MRAVIERKWIDDLKLELEVIFYRPFENFLKCACAKGLWVIRPRFVFAFNKQRSLQLLVSDKVFYLFGSPTNEPNHKRAKI